MNQALANYRFDDAANAIYQFFWGSFCDWYLEIVKLSLDFSEGADKPRGASSPHHARQRLRSFPSTALARSCLSSLKKSGMRSTTASHPRNRSL